MSTLGRPWVELDEAGGLCGYRGGKAGAFEIDMARNRARNRAN